MKVYVAAPYQLRNEAIDVMHQLEVAGHVVTSSWLKDDEDPFDAEKQAAYAVNSLTDVEEADALLALNTSGWENAGTGGRHVELGYALALGKRIVLVGQRTNVFHYLDAVTVVETLEGAIELL